MLRQVLLGLLRDGRARHGYRLMAEYRAATGEALGAGSIYRELRRLALAGLISKAPADPDVDSRRVPYQIVAEGRRVFDDWLERPPVDDRTFSVWTLFIDRVPVALRTRVLDRREGELSRRAAQLGRAHDEAVARRRCGTEYEPLVAQLARRLKLARAELEFLEELRLHLGTCDETPDRICDPPPLCA